MKPTDEMAAEVHRLFAVEHWKVGTIARQTGLHHRRVSRIVGLTSPPPPRKTWDSPLSSFRAFIVDTLGRYPQLRATRLFDMLWERGYRGSARSVRRYVKPLRPARLPEVFLELETLPGEQAQVDWAHVGKIAVPGGERALWMFVMVLSHSRALYAELVLDLTVHSLVRSLCRASTYFGGCPRQWLFDNPKTVVLARAGQETRFHPVLLEAAVALRVQPRLCTVRKPTDKGKVERSIRYLRERFLAGRTIVSVAQGNAELRKFMVEVSHARPHPRERSSTVGQMLETEQPTLLALPAELPLGEQSVPTRVDRQAFVQFETNRYSVPPQHVGKAVTLRVSDEQLYVLDAAERIATHARCFGKHQRVEAPEHRTEVLVQRRRARDCKGRDRLLVAAPRAQHLLESLLRDGHNVGLCTVRLLHLLDLYGDEVFRRGMEDVLDRGSTDLSALAVRCDAHRRALDAPLLLPVALPPHVTDRDVIPHDLESYDD